MYLLFKNKRLIPIGKQKENWFQTDLISNYELKYMVEHSALLYKRVNTQENGSGIQSKNKFFWSFLTNSHQNKSLVQNPTKHPVPQ